MIHITDFASLDELAHFVKVLGADTEEARLRRSLYFEFMQHPEAVYPRKSHFEFLVNKSGGFGDFEEYACHLLHEGTAARRIAVPEQCAGTWWELLRSLGKDLTKWGCNSTSECLDGVYDP